jgi:hypothetical protein
VSARNIFLAAKYDICCRRGWGLKRAAWKRGAALGTWMVRLRPCWRAVMAASDTFICCRASKEAILASANVCDCHLKG